MFKGYVSAVGSALTVAITLRKLTAGMTKTATGKKLLLLNTLVGGTAGACASFCNTYCMRMAETEKGINVYHQAELESKAGVSKLAATAAVTETALSRSAMSVISVGLPAALILSLAAVGVAPKGKLVKTAVELNCVTMGLVFGLPLSVSLFPPVSIKKGSELEKEFHSSELIYFSKGL
jgi:hypothetical protein